MLLDSSFTSVGPGLIASGAARAAIAPMIVTIVRVAATKVEYYAKIYAPVRTGRLASSIHVVFVSPMEAHVVTNVHYAIYQEFGTKRHKASPFFRPAAKMVETELGGLVKTQTVKAFG